MRTFLLGVVGVMLPHVLGAQSPAQTIPISGEPTCTNCRVDVTRIFTVGEIPGAATGRDSRIVSDSSGNYLVVVEPGPRIAVVDSTGRFLRFHPWLTTRADRSARGVIPLMHADGSAHIFDGATQWHFDSTGRPEGPSETISGNYVTMGLGAVWSLVIPAASTSPHLVQLALPSWHSPFPSAVPAGGNVLVRDSVVSNGACRDCTDIVLNVSFEFTKSTMWTASADRYRINLFDQWGRRWLQSFDVAASWLPLRDSSAYRPGRTLPEAPRILGLRFDQNGCTFLTSTEQRAALGPTMCERRLWVGGLTTRDTTASDENLRYRTVVDVLGLTARRQLRVDEHIITGGSRVIARVELPGRVELFGPGLAYQHRALPNGNWALDVFRISVLER